MTLDDDARSPVDLDQLADYVEGVLPQTEAAAVERRIASDPRWARLADQLRTSGPAVTDTLRSNGATDAMPEDIFQRIIATLPDRSSPSTTNPATAAPPTKVVSLDERRRRRTPWSPLVKVAAAVIVIGGLGVGVGALVHGDGGSKSSGVSDSAGSAAHAPPGTLLSGASVTATYRDYGSDLQPESSTGAIPRPQGPLQESGSAGTGSSGGAAGGPAQPLARVPAGLERLDDSQALAACFGALAGQFPGQPAHADFGYYRGKPVVVVTVGTRQIAVGPSCGLSGRGADVVATSR